MGGNRQLTVYRLAVENDDSPKPDSASMDGTCSQKQPGPQGRQPQRYKGVEEKFTTPGCEVVCSARLLTDHYSTAVSPCGRFIAACECCTSLVSPNCVDSALVYFAFNCLSCC